MPSKIDLHELHAATITSGIDRDALLLGIDRHFTMSIPQLPSRAAQLLRDLHELESAGQLTDGTNPFRTWLLNAVRLSALRLEGQVFQRALALLDAEIAAARAQAAAPRAPASAAPAASKGLLYISASPRDLSFVERLRGHLSPLVRQGLTVWDRTQIRPGAETSKVVEQKLAAATLVVPLLSADYLAESDTYTELASALKRRDLELIPVLVRPCLWSSFPELAGRRILPRNKKAITSHSDVESALNSVTEDLQAIVADLTRASQAESPPPTFTEADRGARDGSRPAMKATPSPPLSATAAIPATAKVDVATAGEPLSAIFSRSGDPKRLYVQPAQMRRIKASVGVLGRGLVIEGPSKIGKTTALRQAIDGLPARWLNAYDADGEKEILGALAEREIEGLVVIDNAQRLSDDTMERIARRMRVEADNRAAKGKLTLVGTPGVARRLTIQQRDLSGRFDEVRMLRQPDEKIREMVDLVERVARLRFTHKDAIVRASRGSFQLAQELCYESAISADIDEVPAMETAIPTKLVDILREVQSALARQFDDVALSLATADSHTPTPGAGLAFLWVLSRTEEDGVRLSSLMQEYPALSPAWKLWESGKLELGRGDPTQSAAENAPAGPDPKEVVQLTSGKLVSEDPLFRFYLQGVRWGDLAVRARISIGWQPSDGKLLIGVEAPAAASVRPERSRSLYDNVTYPFSNPDALALRDLLMGAYSDIDQMKSLAVRTGVSLNHFAPGNGAPEPAWNSLLDVATRQQKLRVLIKGVLADGFAGSYHESIEKTLAKLGVNPSDS